MTTEADIQSIYVAYYGRAADPAGLAYWVEHLKDATNGLADIVNDFGTSDEYVARYGDLSNAELVNNLYLQMFNREAEQEGLDFYVDWLETGHSTLAEIALDIINGVQGDDVQVIENKVLIAGQITEEIDLLQTSTETIFYNSDADAETVKDFIANVEWDTTVTSDDLLGLALQLGFSSESAVEIPDNSAPEMKEGASLALTLTEGVDIGEIILADYFTDPDDDNLTYTISALPAGLSMEAGIITGAPSFTSSASYDLTLTVTDDNLRPESIDVDFTWGVADDPYHDIVLSLADGSDSAPTGTDDEIEPYLTDNITNITAPTIDVTLPDEATAAGGSINLMSNEDTPVLLEAHTVTQTEIDIGVASIIMPESEDGVYSVFVEFDDGESPVLDFEIDTDAPSSNISLHTSIDTGFDSLDNILSAPQNFMFNYLGAQSLEPAYPSNDAYGWEVFIYDSTDTQVASMAFISESDSDSYEDTDNDLEAELLDDGVYHFRSTLTDRAGNTSAVMQGDTFTIDNTAPTLTDISINADGDVELTFSEALAAYTLDADDFLILDDSDVAITPENIDYDATGTTILIELPVSTVDSVIYDTTVLQDIAGNPVSGFNWSGGAYIIEGTDAAETLLNNMSARAFMYGYGGDDILTGGDYDDTLYGGDGADVLTGGAGVDIFTYAKASEFGDTITDFQTTDSDEVALALNSDIFGNAFSSSSSSPAIWILYGNLTGTAITGSTSFTVSSNITNILDNNDQGFASTAAFRGALLFSETDVVDNGYFVAFGLGTGGELYMARVDNGGAAPITSNEVTQVTTIATFPGITDSADLDVVLI